MWRQEILPAWETERCTKRTLMLWWEGVPSALRSELWPRAIGNRFGLTRETFDQALAEATPADHANATARVERELLRADDAPASFSSPV